MLVRMGALCVGMLVGCGGHSGTRTTTPSEQQPPYVPPQPKSALELSYHSGSTLHDVKLKAIFWGTSWTADENYTGIQQFLDGFAGSNYLSVLNEYPDSQGPTTSLGGTYDKSAMWDNTSVPDIGGDTTPLADEACRITNYSPDPSTIYMFYTDRASSSTNDCAWHSYFECEHNGVTSRAPMVYIPNTDAMQDCVMKDTTSGHGTRLAMMANLSAHELAESITNPFDDGWYDSEKSNICDGTTPCEIADKCAWVFNRDSEYRDILVEMSNKTSWKLQMLWSNKAYEANKGKPNNLSQYGCVVAPAQ